MRASVAGIVSSKSTMSWLSWASGGGGTEAGGARPWARSPGSRGRRRHRARRRLCGGLRGAAPWGRGAVLGFDTPGRGGASPTAVPLIDLSAPRARAGGESDGPRPAASSASGGRPRPRRRDRISSNSPVSVGATRRPARAAARERLHDRRQHGGAGGGRIVGARGTTPSIAFTSPASASAISRALWKRSVASRAQAFANHASKLGGTPGKILGRDGQRRRW